MALDAVEYRKRILQILRNKIPGASKLSTSELLKEANKRGVLKTAREEAKKSLSGGRKTKGGIDAGGGGDTGGGGKTKKAKKVTRKPETEKPVRKTRRHSPTSKKTTKKTTSKKTTKKTTTKKAVRKTKRHSPQYTQEQIRAAARQAYKNKTGKAPSEEALNKIVARRGKAQTKDTGRAETTKGSKGKEVGKRTPVNMEAWRDNFRNRYGRWPTKEELKARKNLKPQAVVKTGKKLPTTPRQKTKQENIIL